MPLRRHHKEQFGANPHTGIGIRAVTFKSNSCVLDFKYLNFIQTAAQS